MFTSKELALDIAKWGEEKIASNVVILEVGQVSTIADYFVIMHATNRTQTSAILDFIGEEVGKKYSLHYPHKEGRQSGDWLLLDFGIVVVHVFLDEARSFYDLERLWIDAPRLEAGV